MDVSLRVHEQWVTKSSFKKTWKQKKKLSKLTLNFWVHICFFYRYSVIWSDRFLYIWHSWLVSVMSKFLYFDFLIAVLAKHFVKFIRQVHEIKHIRDYSKAFFLYKYFHLMFGLKPHNRSEVPSPYGSVVVFWKFGLLFDNW